MPLRAPVRRVALALSAVIFGVALAGCSNATASSDKGNEQGFVSGLGTVTKVDVADRKAGPDLKGATLGGSPFDLSALKGKVVVLNVWASWCGPCRAEAPALERVAQDLRPQGVQFVGLDTRDSDASATAFVDNYGVTYDSVIDRDGQLQLAFRKTIPPSAIPSTLVLDRQGRVAGRYLGPITEPRLRELIAPVLAETS
jgi:thiol-disulfide isomerase/thioredoxin